MFFQNEIILSYTLFVENFAHFRAGPQFARNCAKISTEILKFIRAKMFKLYILKKAIQKKIYLISYIILPGGPPSLYWHREAMKEYRGHPKPLSHRTRWQWQPARTEQRRNWSRELCGWSLLPESEERRGWIAVCGGIVLYVDYLLFLVKFRLISGILLKKSLI